MRAFVRPRFSHSLRCFARAVLLLPVGEIDFFEGRPLGTGNSDIVLDSKLSDKRTYPAIDVQKSGTRKEDLLLDAGDLQKVFILRKILSSMGTVDAMEFLLDKMKDCKTNEEFFSSMNH